MNYRTYGNISIAIEFMTKISFVILMLAGATFIFGITVDMYFTKPCSCTPVVPAKHVEQPAAVPQSCTAEQAIMWWNNSKDIKAAKTALCGK